VMKRYLLILILLLGIFLRIWQIGNVPVSPDWDEAALGYNAYSILQTGRDEYGEFLPLTLRSFDDYKPALYAYLIIPFIKLFGLSVIAVRLPSILFGIASLFGLYYLLRELLPQSITLVGKRVESEYIALLSVFFLAISPWHVQFSRVAFEANVGLACNIYAVLFFIKGIKRPIYLLASAFFFGINLYVYQSQKVFSPFLLLLMTGLFFKDIFRVSRVYLLSAIGIGLIISLPFIMSLVTDSGSLARARGVSFLSDKTPLLEENTKRLQDDRERNDYIGLVLDNRRFVYLKTFLAGYVSHFDPNWLFIKGDFENNRHHAPDMGLVYSTLIPFILMGIYLFIFSESIPKRTKLFILAWILFVPLPASFTKDVPHAVRTLQMSLILQLFTALGLLGGFFLLQRLRLPIFRYVCYGVIGISFGLNVCYYFNQYFVQMQYYYAKDWQYGYKELVSYITPLQDNYEKIIVSNRGTMDQSYIFFLFYMQYDPKHYLQEGGTKSGGLSEQGNSFANFEFRPFSYLTEKNGKTLFIGSPADFPEVGEEIHKIYYPNKPVNTDVAIRIVE
jgi:4-amino-4-deoxy-L-arabinose transferase-like glycosyltransferase